VRAASASLRRLPAFNREQNLLELPFRMRLGIHTGESLVDLERGVAYSTVLDVAGHLQKQAEVDGCWISEATLRELPSGLPFEPAGKLEREGIASFRLAGAVE
jgi:class 3 adenylate cyclase